MRCPKAPRKASSSLPKPTARHPTHSHPPTTCSEEPVFNRCPRALPVTSRRRPKPLPNGGTPMWPSPRPPPPKRQPPTGQLRARNPDAERPRCPVTEVTRGDGAPVHDMSETNDGRTDRCPSEEGRSGLLNAQPPLQAAAPVTHPTATESTTSAAIIRCHRGALSTRGWIEHVQQVLEQGTDALGAANPRRSATTAQPAGDDRGEPRAPNRRPATTIRRTRR